MKKTELLKITMGKILRALSRKMSRSTFVKRTRTRGKIGVAITNVGRSWRFKLKKK